MRPLAAACLTLFALLPAAARAEIVPSSPAELEKQSTHIVVGTVALIGTAVHSDKDWEHTGGVVEIKVSRVEKGKRIEEGDCVYARFWRQAWIGKGDPPPFGSGHHLPKHGDQVRAYLKASNGGYDALLPNGIEVLPKEAAPVTPAAQPATPPASNEINSESKANSNKSTKLDIGLNQDSAVKIAESVLVKVYGESVLEERPWNITPSNSSFTFVGTLPAKYQAGGVALIEISRKNAEVLRITHGK